jgi:glutamyl-Q tRNA(Asp) synthetase
MKPTYCGRFAPSPTGPLHFGSLIAAVGSFLDARSAGGIWLVRIEDLDPPREIPGAADGILRTLERFEMYWDETVLYQSQNHSAYQEALEKLSAKNCIYPCRCSRRDVREATGQTALYPGTCRNGIAAGDAPRSIRMRVDNTIIEYKDRLVGKLQENLATETGDFIIKRADDLFAYQLAVVVDDAAQDITDIVRGHDLFDNTARQIYLQQQLGLATPRYLHLPLATWPDGSKYSKQTQAPSLSHENPASVLLQALRFLKLSVPDVLAHEKLDVIWQWAIKNWDSRNLPLQQSIVAQPLS